MKVSVFNGIKATPEGNREIDKLLDLIRDGAWMNDIKNVRLLEGDARKEAKAKLYGATFSGTFSYRKAENIIEHSGFICLDFDHVNVNETKKELKANHHIYACWTSPSGDGVKALVKIPTDDHYGYFLALKKKFPNMDDACKDVSRLCFMSWDEELYRNPDALTWRQKEEKQTFEVEVSTGNIFAPIQEGGRNAGLLRSAAKLLRNSSLSKDDILQIMENQNAASPDPLPRSEFEKVMENALKYHAPDEFNEDSIHNIWHSTYIDPYEMLEKPIQVISIRNFTGNKITTQRLFSAGNISSITGKQKSKKSFLCSLLMAAASSDEMIEAKLIGGMPADKRLCYYFDTEQAAWDVQRLAKNVMDVGGNLANVNFFSLRKFTPDQRYKIIRHAMLSSGKSLGYVIIDGIADLLKSVNDEEGSMKLVNDLMQWTVDYGCHITVVIHNKKGENYATGHIGSTIMKKSEAVISMIRIEDRPEAAEVESTDMRGAPHFKKFDIVIDEMGKPNIPDLKKLASSYEEEETPF